MNNLNNYDVTGHTYKRIQHHFLPYFTLFSVILNRAISNFWILPHTTLSNLAFSTT